MQLFGTRGAFGRGSLAAALARFWFWWGIVMGRAESRAGNTIMKSPMHSIRLTAIALSL